MAFYIDRTRLTTTSALCSFDERLWVYPSDMPTFDQLEEYAPSTITFGSNQQTGTATYYFTSSTSGFGTLPWTWAAKCDVTVNNGFGATTTTTVTLATGSGTAAEAATGKSVNVGACTCQWDTSIDYTTIRWEIIESAMGGVGTTYPDVSYACTEQASVGSTALARITVNGTAVTATGAVGTASNCNHKLDVAWTYRNNTTTSKSFTVSGQSINGLSLTSSIPTYSHTANSQSTTATQSIVTGQGIGAPYYGLFSSAQVSTSTTYRRDITVRGRIQAFNQSYPDNLTCRVTGYDNATTGYRDVTAINGSFDASDTFEVWSVSSTLMDPSASPSTQSSSRNTVPAWVYADVSASSLSALGDDSTNTTMYLRGWHYTGAGVQQAQTVAISTGVTTATRTWASPGVGLNSYRYLRVQIRRTAGTTQTATVSITTQPGSVIKSWDVPVSSGTFVYAYLDLCSPDNQTATIDETDNPYPRINPSDPTNAGQATDGPYWGITRATQIALTGTSVEMGDIHLSSSSGATAWCTGYWAPTITWTRQKMTAFGGNTQTTNRLYQGDTEGNTQAEEGWALWQTSPASNALQTITAFVADINAVDAGVVRHQGYSATASTANTSPTYIRNGYANSVTGYAIWLGGVTFRRSQGVKRWYATDQSAGGADVSVVAQTMFRKLAGAFVPDAFDPFEQEDAGTQYWSIGAVSYQRGRAHGIVLGTDTDPYPLQTVYLRRDSDLSSRGSGLSATNGVYATGLPGGLGMVNHNTVCGTLDTGDPDPLYTHKQQRAVFKATSPTGTFVSADRNPVNQHYYATVQSGTVSLWQAQGPLATAYTQTVTSITGAANLHMRCPPNDPSYGILLLVEASAGGLTRYYTVDEGATFVATVINATGNQPAVCVDDIGFEYYIWRTSGGAIQGKTLDAAGNVLMTATTLVAANVADSSIDIYERLDDLYIVYQHTTNGITVVRSTDRGNTYS